MADDDYSDDTHLDLDRLVGEALSPDESVTNPMLAAAPDAVRQRFERSAYEEKTVDQPFVRDVLQAAAAGSDDPDATFESSYDDDETEVHQALKLPKLPKRPPKRDSPQVESPPRRRPTTSGLVPKTQRRSASRPSASKTSAPAPRVAPPQPPVTPPLAEPVAPVLARREERPDTAEQLQRLGLTRRTRANANHVRANSGFYSLPEANVDATAEHIMLEESNRVAIGLFMAIVLGLIGGLGVLGVALTRWMQPSTVMALTLLAMVICSAAVASVVVPQGQKLRLSGLRRSFLPMGIATAIPLICGLAWQLGFVRAAVRPLAGSTPETSRRVLNDQSVQVALAECLVVAPRHEYRPWRAPLLETLAGRPELSQACVNGLDPKVGETVSALLAERWHQELLGGGVDADRACDITASLGALARPTGEIETRLLTCILDGPTTFVQACCGRTLVQRSKASNEWIEAIREQDGYVPSEAMAAGLMTLAFHQEGVTPSQLEFVAAANFSGRQGRAVALSLTCDALQEGTAALSRHFAASLGEACPVDVANVSRSRELWLAVCEVSVEEVANGGEPAKALCEATQQALVAQAVSDASRIIASASKDRGAKRRMAIAIDVEAITARGASASTVMQGMQKWNADRAAKKRESDSKPSFKPNW